MEFPEKITCMGIECTRNAEASVETGAVYEGKLTRGEMTWFTVIVTALVLANDEDKRPLWAVDVRGAQIVLTHRGRDLDAINRLLGARLSAMIRDIEMLSQVAPIANLSLAAALYRFGLDWEKLPPLIRASMAHVLFDYHQRQLNDETRSMFNAQAQGFHRRSRVRGAFRSAAIAFLDLLAPLVKQADRDAEAMGVDTADLEQESFNLGNLGVLVSTFDRAEVEKEILFRASSAVVEGIDRELAAEVAEIKKEAR